MIAYCPPNVTLSQVWTKNGISHCFVDTVSASAIAGFLLIFGTLQLLMYRRYAILVDDVERIRKSKLYNLQIFLSLLVPALALIRFILQSTFYDGGKVYGFMVSAGQAVDVAIDFNEFKFLQIVAVMLTCFAYPFSILLVVKERYYLLPSTPTRGHGLVLLVFWSLVFIVENLSFINMRHEDWWFNLSNTKDKVEMTFFVLRYVSGLFIFILGLKAPGIASHYDDDHDRLIDENSVSDIYLLTVFILLKLCCFPSFQENRSTWTNAWSKIKTLTPFLWPRKDIVLQIKVILCFVLLIGGRVINLFVPIYNKKIGKLQA